MIGRRHTEDRRDRQSGKRQRFDRNDASPSRRTSTADAVGPLRSPLADRTFRTPYNDSHGSRSLRSGKRLDMRRTRGERNHEMRDRENRGKRSSRGRSQNDELFFMDRHGARNRREDSQQLPPEISCPAEFPTLGNTSTQSCPPKKLESHAWNTRTTESDKTEEKCEKIPKRSRQSTESSDCSWGDMVMEDEERTERVVSDLERFQRRLRSAHSSGTQEDPGSVYECDVDVLKRRQKQIDYGKRTNEYDHYTIHVPKKERSKDHPWTPNKFLRHSRRNWDSKVRTWRKLLHIWDPPNTNSVDDGVSVSSETSVAFDEPTPGSSQSDERMLSESLGRISVTPPPGVQEVTYNNCPLEMEPDDVEFLEI